MTIETIEQIKKATAEVETIEKEEDNMKKEPTIEQLDEQFGTAVIFPDYCLPSEAVSKKIEKALAESNATFDCGCTTFKELKKFSSPFIEERLYFKKDIRQFNIHNIVLVPFYRGAVVFREL